MDLDEKVIKAIEKIENSAAPMHPFELFGIEIGYGWYGLTLPIIKEIRRYNEKYPDDKIFINQIKEKWGRLEIYTSGIPDYIDKMILKAGYESEHICELCGARGRNIEIDGWYMTLCEEHIKARQKANYDYHLEDRLYKDSLDIENYGWKEYKPKKYRNFKFIKMKKDNYFMAKKKVGDKWCMIIIEREEEKTNLFLRDGKENKKLEIYVEYIRDKENTLHEGYWYIMENNEKISIGLIKEHREWQERLSIDMVFDRVENGKNNFN
jgi:phage pi2 protein 07